MTRFICLAVVALAVAASIDVTFSPAPTSAQQPAAAPSNYQRLRALSESRRQTDAAEETAYQSRRSAYYLQQQQFNYGYRPNYYPGGYGGYGYNPYYVNPYYFYRGPYFVQPSTIYAIPNAAYGFGN